MKQTIKQSENMKINRKSGDIGCDELKLEHALPYGTGKKKRKRKKVEEITESRKATAFCRAWGVEDQSRAVAIAWATLLALILLLLSSILIFTS